MIALDTDVVTRLLQGDPVVGRKASQVPSADRVVPIVVVEELLRGRLNLIRQAESGKRTMSIHRAYELFEGGLADVSSMKLLPYTAMADNVFKTWRAQKIRVGTHDLRIAAICVSNGVALATGNQRDFAQVPGLSLEIW